MFQPFRLNLAPLNQISVIQKRRGEKAHQQLTFVEWDAPGGFPRVQTTADYKASAPYFQSGITKLEFCEMSVSGNTQQRVVDILRFSSNIRWNAGSC